MRLPRSALRCLLSLGSFVLALLCANVVLERVWPVGQPLQRLDPLLLAQPIPGARSVLYKDRATGGERIFLRLNEHGFRGPALAPPVAGPRVVVFGDSLVMAENVRESETFVQALERELEQRSGAPLECVNAGVTGYGPDQALLRFEAVIEDLQAQAVVLVLCANNDFGDPPRNMLYGIDAEGKLERRYPQLSAKLLAEFEQRETAAKEPAMLRALRAAWRSWSATREPLAHDHALNPLIPLYLTQARDEWMQAVREELGLVRNLLRDVYDADVAIYPDCESARYKQALFHLLLQAWAEATQRRDLPLLVVVVPSAVDLDPDFAIRVDPTLYPTYDPRRLSSTMTELARAAGLAVLDLYKQFREPPEGRWFEGHTDFHWSAAGQALAARQAAEALQPLLQGR